MFAGAPSSSKTTYPGISNYWSDQHKPLRSEDPIPSTQIDRKSVAKVYYDEMTAYLENYTAKETGKPRASLARLTRQRFEELSGDVYDELLRRKNSTDNINGDLFLPARVDLQPKRNQARRKLATLPDSRFKDFCGDILQELGRRYPEVNDPQEDSIETIVEQFCRQTVVHERRNKMSNTDPNVTKREILVGFGVDVDAVAGWLGSYGGEDSPSDISRGMYSGEVGTPRLLKLFERFGIKTTWFIPGHSLETFPEQMAAVRDAGHEIGLHGYSHENPKSLTFEQQRDILDHTYKLLTDFCGGKPPKGSVAPWWETSKEGTDLLLDKGIEYDHSNMAHDSQAYYLRDADSWTPIDYSARAETWMKPLQRGNETGLVELPGNWYLDDLPPMMFIKSSSNSHGWVNTRDVEDLWKDTFSYLYREEQDFIFPITIHPDVSGRPHVLMMLERFITWINTHEHVRWVPMIEMSRAFRAKKAPVPGARMPAGFKPEEPTSTGA